MTSTRCGSLVAAALLLAACAAARMGSQPVGDVRLERMEDPSVPGSAGVTVDGKAANVRLILPGGEPAYALPEGYSFDVDLESSSGLAKFPSQGTQGAATAEFIFFGVPPGEYKVRFSVARDHKPVGPMVALDGKPPSLAVQKTDKVHIYSAVLDKDVVSRAIKVLAGMNLDQPPWNKEPN